MKQLVVSTLVLVAVILGWGQRSLGESGPAPRGELRIIDKHPWNWIWITFNVFEHLMDLDKEGTLVPRLATGWRWLDDHTLEVTLRQGVTFHNGKCSIPRSLSSTGTRTSGCDSRTAGEHI
jgi:ABC-type transport system substrate-binding protein